MRSEHPRSQVVPLGQYRQAAEQREARAALETTEAALFGERQNDRPAFLALLERPYEYPDPVQGRSDWGRLLEAAADTLCSAFEHAGYLAFPSLDLERYEAFLADVMSYYVLHDREHILAACRAHMIAHHLYRFLLGLPSLFALPDESAARGWLVRLVDRWRSRKARRQAGRMFDRAFARANVAMRHRAAWT
jgi:hypothetical protein